MTPPSKNRDVNCLKFGTNAADRFPRAWAVSPSNVRASTRKKAPIKSIGAAQTSVLRRARATRPSPRRRRRHQCRSNVSAAPCTPKHQLKEMRET